MNTKSEDVVKNVELNQVESTSNEQRQTVKPIVISRRRLLRAGVAGIPVVLTMAGLAPGQSIMGQASAASGLVYGGTGVGVRARFDGTSKVANDNLVWSTNNGFVIDKYDNNKLFSEEISTTSRTDPSEVSNIILVAAEDSTKTKAVAVTPKSYSDAFKFIAYLHKSAVYYTDMLITKVGNTEVAAQSIEDFFKSINTTSEVLEYFDFTIGDTTTVNVNDKVSDASVTGVSVNFDSSWSRVQGYELNSDTATTYYYRVPETTSNAFTVKLKVTATISGISETVDESVDGGGTVPKTYNYSCSSASSNEMTFTFAVQGKTYTSN